MSEPDIPEQVCSICGKKVAAQSFLVHQVHCERNFYRCACGATMAKSQREAHEATAHKVEKCPHCGFSAPALQLPAHKCKKPPQTCEFCKAQVPFEDIVDHVRECGSRTDRCSVCGKYIQKWELRKHESTCAGASAPVEPPRSQRPNRFLKPGSQAEEVKNARSEPVRQAEVKPVARNPVPGKPGAAGKKAGTGAGKAGAGKPGVKANQPARAGLHRAPPAGSHGVPHGPSDMNQEDEDAELNEAIMKSLMEK